MRVIAAICVVGALAGGASADIALDAEVKVIPDADRTCPEGMRCGTDAKAAIAKTAIEATHVDTGSDAMNMIVIGDHYFDAGGFEIAVGRMSDDMYRARHDRAAISKGTFADGSPAAVVRFEWSEQTFWYGMGAKSDVIVKQGPWVRHADIALCRLDEPACSKTERHSCSSKGCTATFRNGVLTVRSVK